MAVQILNDMPDAAIHRGDAAALSKVPVAPPANEPALGDWSPRASRANTQANRPMFVAITIGLHVVAVLGFLSVKYATRVDSAPAPIEVALIEELRAADEAPPLTPPPMAEVSYVLPVLDQLSFEPEPVNAPTIATNAIAQPSAHNVVPPMVESVEYVRAPAPVYPRESSRRHEYGTVVLRVLVDPAGLPSQIQVERSSGFERLDVAARSAVEKALFRPHEVNGVAQAAQVLIPIEFTRRAG
jgi:periplasmic protein TonB